MIPIPTALDAYTKISLMFVEGVFRQKSLSTKLTKLRFYRAQS